MYSMIHCHDIYRTPIIRKLIIESFWPIISMASKGKKYMKRITQNDYLLDNGEN